MNPMQIRAIVGPMVETCFLCKWIEQDLQLNGKLTDWPFDSNDKGQFPTYGKLGHLELEKASLDNRLTSRKQ